MVAGVGAGGVADFAGAVDDDDRGDVGDVVGDGDLLLGVEQDGEGDFAVAGMVLKFGETSSIDADGDEAEAKFVLAGRKLAQGGHLGFPGVAPEGPEVEDDDFALVVGERNGAPLSVGEREAWRLAADKGPVGGFGGAGRGVRWGEAGGECDDGEKSAGGGEPSALCLEGAHHLVSPIWTEARPLLPRTSGK